MLFKSATISIIFLLNRYRPKTLKELWNMEDEKIINLYFERNESAVDETALKYGQFLKSIAYNILGDNMDSEECENDTYYAAWNKIPPEKPRNLSAFLARITRNTALNKYDYYHAAKRKNGVDIALSELEDCIASKDTVDAQYEQTLAAKHISDFLRETNYIKRVVFVRRYWYLDSISDISARYKYSESKVKSILMRTRNSLRKYLERQGVTI